MTDDDRAAPPPATATPVPPPRGRAARVVLGLAGVAALAGISVLGTMATLWHTQAGTRWLLRHAPGLRAVEVHGSLGSGLLQVGSLHVEAGAVSVDASALRLTGLRLAWHPASGVWLGVALDEATATSVQVITHPAPTTAPRQAPRSLRSPVSVEVARLRVDRLAIGDAQLLRELDAGLAIGADGGRTHRLDRVSVAWERIQAQGHVQVATDGALQVSAELLAHDAPAPADGRDTQPAPAWTHWNAQVTANGPLAELALQAHLRGAAPGDRAAPQADLVTRVTPFADLPLSEVQAQVTELDLAALSAHAPATRLGGHLTLATTRPAALDVDLHNASPGAWSAGGLPVSALTAHLSAPWNAAFLDLARGRVAFADASGSGGELRAQGHWEGGLARLELDLDQVRPARLDARLGDWRINGPLQLEGTNLPAPAALWHAAPPASATAPGAPASASAAWSLRMTGRLAGTAPPLGRGREAVVPPPMSLQADARLVPDSLQVDHFDLRAGDASATAKATLRRIAGDRWSGEAGVQWTRLDPGMVWRPAAGASSTELNGQASLRVSSAPVEWQGLAGLRGDATAELSGSRVAGLPLEAHARLDARGTDWTLDAQAHSGDNEAHAEATLRAAAAAGDAIAFLDRLHLSVDAPALEVLAAAVPASLPVMHRKAEPASVPASVAASASASSVAAPASGPPVRGSANIDLAWTGHLPLGARRASAARSSPWTLDTQGRVDGLAIGAARLEQLRWRAQGSSDPQAPLAATLAAREARWGEARIVQARATLDGTLARHHFSLQAVAPLDPPAWLAHLAALGDADATQLDAEADGHWQPDDAPGSGWQGRIDRLALRAVPLPEHPAGRALAAATAAAAATTPAWLEMDPVDLSVGRDAADRWQSLRVGAGRAHVAGLGVSWQPVTWTAAAGADAAAHWDIDAAVAPFSVAGLLARAQPDLGWHGDLEMEAHLHAAFDGRWHLNGRLARTAGDLAVAEFAPDPNSAVTPLGLSDARFQVTAEGADWQADVAISGARLGELAGHWTAQAGAPDRLPDMNSPLRGTLHAHVADMNVWGAWLPPGWRLGGELRTELALSGRWGAPELTGQVTAQRLQVRNALEGVYARDGDLSIRLDGDRARIEQLRIAGGTGSLTVTGDASLGAAPVARLHAQASQFQALGRIDRRLVLSGDADLRLAADAVDITGKLAVDEGLFDLTKGDSPTLDSDVAVLDASAPAADTAESQPAAPRAGRSTRLDLGVDLGDKLRLRGRGIDTLLRGKLQLGSAGGPLTLRGAVRTEGGTYKAYGQNLQVTRGVLTFTGPIADPRLDILATRPNLDIVVGVAITGSAQAPHVQLVSEPDMTDADKLSWLMLGRAPEGLGGADTALLQQAAIALLAGENEAPTDQLLNRLGLTEFSFRQQQDVNDVRQTVVTLGRQLSRRWYVGYERGVNATTGSWQLIYRIAQRLTVRAQSGEDVSTATNGNSLDVIYTWKWN